MFIVGEKVSTIRSACLVDCGTYFHDKNSIDKAINYYNRALHLDPENFYAHANLAAAFVAKRQFREALYFCNKSISMKGNDILANILLFITYKGLGENNSAEEALAKIFEVCKGNKASAYNRLAYTYLRSGIYKEAELYIKKAIEIDPNQAVFHNNLGKIYFAQGDLIMAREEYQKVLELATNKHDKRLKRYATYHIEEIDRNDTTPKTY